LFFVKQEGIFKIEAKKTNFDSNNNVINDNGVASMSKPKENNASGLSL
jgi:hypothetical protein